MESKGWPEAVIEAVKHHHERLDSSGYPDGLNEESMSEYDKIISLVNVYEAMIHKRPYGDHYLPFDALAKILDNKKAFENKIIKILIERFGVFPLGSLVELNTKEIARVVKLNYEIPLRPVVQILYDTEGKALPKSRILDMTAQPSIYIKDSIRETALRSKL